MKTKELLEKVFEVLNKSGLDYVIQNKYEMMPEIIPSDIDMFYRNANEKRLDEIVKDVAQETNLIIVQKILQGYYQFTYILSYSAPTSFFQLQLDFYEVMTSKKSLKHAYNPALMLDNKKHFKCFYIPDSFDEIYFQILRRTIKKDLTDDHLRIIQDKYFCNETENRNKLIEKFGLAVSSLIIEMIQTQNKNLFFDNYSLFQKHLHDCERQNFTLTKSIKQKYFTLFRKVPLRVFHKNGLSVAFLSPDGGGKSSIIKKIKETCGGSFHGTDVKYFRPRLLKNAGHYNIKNQTSEDVDNPDPHGRPMNGIIKSLYRYFFYNIDFLLGTWLTIVPLKIQQKLIIFDRYYYDYYVDMKRYQYKLPEWFPKLFSFMIPRPDLVFILDAPAEVLYKRKQELSLEEIERQRTKYLKLATQLKNAYLISSNQPIEKVTEDVTRILLSFKAEQTKKILY